MTVLSVQSEPDICDSQNGVLAGVYPASPSSWLIVVIAMMSSLYINADPSLGMIDAIKENLPHKSVTACSFLYPITHCYDSVFLNISAGVILHVSV